MARHCPQCASTLKPDGSCECGYGAKPKSQGHDPDWWRCTDTDQAGARCSKPGSLSMSTRGGGPYFCSGHFPPFRGGKHGVGPTPGLFANLRSLTRQAPPITKPIDFEAEIERQAIQGEAAE